MTEEASTEGVKRSRDEVNSENVGSAELNTDGFAHPAKKLRPDNAEVTEEVAKVCEEVAEEESLHCNDQIAVAEVTEHVEKGDIQEHDKHEVRKDLSDQTERNNADVESGDDADEDKDIAENDNGTNEHANEVKLGPRMFTTSVDMLNFFYDLLRGWPLNFNLNKYEYMMLEDLINKGHQEPQRKIGAGIAAFQVRVNPEFYSRCYYVIRKDGSFEDFSYRKCVDNIIPLPDSMKAFQGKKKSGHKNHGGNRGKHENNRGGRFGRGRGNQGHASRKRF